MAEINESQEAQPKSKSKLIIRVALVLVGIAIVGCAAGIFITMGKEAANKKANTVEFEKGFYEVKEKNALSVNLEYSGANEWQALFSRNKLSQLDAYKGVNNGKNYCHYEFAAITNGDSKVTFIDTHSDSKELTNVIFYLNKTDDELQVTNVEIKDDSIDNVY